MAVLVTPSGQNRPSSYTKFSFLDFDSWDALSKFISEASVFLTSDAIRENNNFGRYVQYQLDSLTGPLADNSSYGLFGRHPRTFQEALSRDKFLYWDEYKKIKSELFQKIQERLALSSTAEIMKPKMVFNDKQIGEFIYDRAAMALEPMVYFYSEVHKREINLDEEKIFENKKGELFLEKDNTKVIRALKVEKEDGEIVYVELKGEESLREASDLGIVSVTSGNKKVYLYKEKKPRMFNSVKIITALTMGGFTSWTNDFWTGIATVLTLEVLESLGYSVEIEVALGGGRCIGCYPKLNFDGQQLHGRRFILVKLKDFNEQADMDALLYMLCDPSFHNIKFMGMLNTLFCVYGDGISSGSSPAATWHGIEEPDLVFPIGAYVKSKSAKKGNVGLIDLYLHRIISKTSVLGSVLKAVTGCEELNRQALIKYSQHDFGVGA